MNDCFVIQELDFTMSLECILPPLCKTLRLKFSPRGNTTKYVHQKQQCQTVFVNLWVCFVLFFYCSTTGEEVINKMAVENRQAGQDREEIKLADLQEAIAETVYNSNTSKGP